MNWVQTVQALAKDVDRIDVAEQCIGKLLVHAPPDPEDSIWPHKAIRDGLEVWQASHIEKGIYIAKANARGVTSVDRLMEELKSACWRPSCGLRLCICLNGPALGKSS